jgi:hypothetical protein
MRILHAHSLRYAQCMRPRFLTCCLDYDREKKLNLTTFRARVSVPYAIKQVKPRNQHVKSDSGLEGLTNHTLQLHDAISSLRDTSVTRDGWPVPNPLPQH